MNSIRAEESSEQNRALRYEQMTIGNEGCRNILWYCAMTMSQFIKVHLERERVSNRPHFPLLIHRIATLCSRCVYTPIYILKEMIMQTLAKEMKLLVGHWSCPIAGGREPCYESIQNKHFKKGLEVEFIN